MIKLYSNTGTPKLDIYENRSCKRTRKLMEEDSITLKFSKATSVFIEIGDYVDILEGGVSKRFVAIEKFTPTRNTSNRGYDYDLKLEADYMVWKNKVIKYRPTANEAEASFSVTDSIYSHGALLKANIDNLGVEYNIVIDPAIGTQMKNITYSSTSIYDAMITIAETFECEVWVEGRYIKFGYCQGSGTPTEMELGVNVKDMSQDNPNGDYATRVYPFGGTTNIPYSYRKKLEFKIATVDSDNHNITLNQKVCARMFEGDKTYPSEQEISIPYHSRVQTPNASNTDLHEYNMSFASWIENVNIYAGKYKVTESITCWLEALTKEGDNYSVRTATNLESTCGLYLVRVVDDHFEYNLVETKTLKAASAQRLVFMFDTIIPEKTLNDNYVGVMIAFSDTKETWSGSVNNRVVKASVLSGGTLTLESNSFSVTTDTNLGEVVVNPNYRVDSDEASHIVHLNDWDNPSVGDTVTFDTPIPSQIESGWYVPENYDENVISTGRVGKNLMLPVIDEPVISDGIKRTSQYVQDNSVDDEDVIEMVAVFENVIPSFIIDDYEVTYINVERKYEGTDDTYMFKQYILNIPSFADFDTKFIIEDSIRARFIGNSNLSGMDFELVYMGTENNVGKFAIQWNEDYGRELPDDSSDRSHPADNDPFVMLGIDTAFQSASVVSDAEASLAQKAEAYLKELLKNRKTYTVTPYASSDAILSLGSKVTLINDAFFASGFTSRVFGYEYVINKPQAGLTYFVGENSKYSKFKVLESKIDAVDKTGESYGAGTIGGQLITIIKLTDDTEWSDLNVLSSKRAEAEFVSRTHDDTKEGNLEIRGNLDVNDDIHSGGNVEAEGGVAAHGITDLSMHGQGGQGTVKGVKVGPNGAVNQPDEEGVVQIPEYPDNPPEVVDYEGLDQQTTEDTTKAASAHAVSLIKENIGIESLPARENRAYKRGEIFKVVEGNKTIGYRVVIPFEAGASIIGKVERLTYETLARPLNIVNIDNILV